MGRGLAVAGSALFLLGCQTITEELPVKPSSVVVVNPTPIVVTPVPIPSPAPAPTPTPAAPAPNPNPAPTPNPVPNPGPSIPPNVPSNTSAVAKVGAKVFFVECDGRPVPDSEHATEAPFGCRIHLDATAKDAQNKPTQAKGTPEWSYSGVDVTVSGKNPYTPVLTPKGRGDLSAVCRLDGVTSNPVNLRIK